MEKLKYIFAQPNYIDGFDKDNPIVIYPVRLKDYDKFTEVSHLLYISKNHFEENEYPLLALVFMCMQQLNLTQEEIIKKLEDTFSIVTRKEVIFVSDEKHKIEGFIIDGKNIITVQNYEQVREIIMKQNLMFEQKVYKNKLVQEWANKVLESRAKNSAKISIEDIITTVSVYKGKSYDELMNYTIYQLYADFYRIRKMKQYDTSTLFATVSTEKFSIEDFAEEINMFKSPYDDLFVDSSKLNKFGSVT
jgi:hypothetical protein